MKAEQKIELSTDLLIDPHIEKKNQVRPSFAGIRYLPDDIRKNAEALFVFQHLMQCFKMQGNVCEGELANVIWGFAQSGIPENLTAAGLAQLRGLGYIKYTDDNYVEYADLDVIINHRKQIWIRYTKKFTDLLADPGNFFGVNK